MKGVQLTLSPKAVSQKLINETENQVQDGPSFSQSLMKGISGVNQSINDSQKMTEDFLTKGKHNIHEVMISLEKADLSFRFMTQVRNKVLDAYNEVMRMPV